MLALLDPHDPAGFPEVSHASRDPNGLLAVGGDLHPERLRQAYRRGIFPWFSKGDPILWWSPDPRTILIPRQVHVSHSLRKHMRRGEFEVSMDQAFESVIRACAQPRDNQGGTWLVPAMIAAYCKLHRQGNAHSVEVWSQQRLVGGLYGVALGRAFFGESMFSRCTDASKIALVHLCNHLSRCGFGLIDCQMHTDHLVSMGAHDITRADFVRRLDQLCPLPETGQQWNQPPVSCRASLPDPELMAGAR